MKGASCAIHLKAIWYVHVSNNYILNIKGTSFKVQWVNAVKSLYNAVHDDIIISSPTAPYPTLIIWGKYRVVTRPHYSYSGTIMVHLVLGGWRVTRFHFGPLNVFVYISHWVAWVNYQNRLHFEGDYRNWWLTRASWCNSTGSKSKQHDNVFMQNWNGTWYN